MENNKISIITVVKNGMPFLKTSIKSFRMQTYINKELIIVFAPSQDGTEEYLNTINDKNIIVKKDKFQKLNLDLLTWVLDYLVVNILVYFMLMMFFMMKIH